MYDYSDLQANSLVKLVTGSVNICTAVAHTRRLLLARRQALARLHPLEQSGRRSLMYGGPSPRMRALASQDRLNLINLAASLGVSTVVAGTEGFCAIVPPVTEDCDVISIGPSRRLCAS
jgi:hypothetical protein